MNDENEEYSDDSLYNISSWGMDMTFRELITMYEEGDLLHPEFQRNYVWKKTEASRFIESVLLGLPVPSIFLARSKENEMLIVDGYQRIMTIYDYVSKKKFAGDKVVFKLTNSQRINERWRNKAFDELTPEDQRRLKTTAIHAIVFEQKKPSNDDTGLFQVFARINTSGRPLNAQEIRNCVCQGPFNKLLIELNRDKLWRELYGSDSPDLRMSDIELILRFFATRDLARGAEERKQINLRKHLDLYMKNCREDSLDEKKASFLRMIRFVHEKFGVNAFTTSSHREEAGKINPVFFEAIAVAVDAYCDRGNPRLTDGVDLWSRRADLLGNVEFTNAAKVHTTKMDNIVKRINLAKQILFPEV